MDLQGRNFLKLLDFTPEEIRYLIDTAKELKTAKRSGTLHRHLTGKNIVLLFEKTSTRTRCAFEVGAMDLGMGVTFLDPQSSQMGKKESIADTARVPVWNGLTDEFHPTQVLADLMTVEEKFGKLKGINFTFMGDARNNMGNSLMIGCAKMGLNFTACAPESLWPKADLIAEAKKIASENGCSLFFTEDVHRAAQNADVLYTDVWVSMGEPDDVWETRIKLLQKYQINKVVMSEAGKQAIFMHCLPSFHDTKTSTGADIARKFGITEMEVTDEVFESEQSVVFDEAENRMHTIKAVMYATLKH